MTNEPENQGEWDRYCQMRPRLRPHVRVYRQHFRGQLWYVFQNSASGRFHRLTPAAYQLIGRFDGSKTIGELMIQCQLNDKSESVIDKGEAIQLVKQLSYSDLLQLDQHLAIDFYRSRLLAYQKLKSWRRFFNPLALKFPFFDPDNFLNHTRIIAKLLFSYYGLAIWLITLLYAGFLAGIHWQELTNNFIDRVLGADNILLLFIIFPLVKIIHELGHGYAAKRWGGEIHEIGVMFLVFMPIPYVDASSVTALREKHRRVIVAAAGMLVEVFIAALAMMIWVNSEPGIIRAIAFNVIFLASVSTLLFNGNPLLRYDGYYMLSDFLEMPNLAPRSNQYIGYLIQRYLFHANIETPDASDSEKVWLFFYGILSFCYRMFVWAAIIFFVATKFFFFGVILAIWGATLMLFRPVYKLFSYLFTSPKLAPVRPRAITISFSFIALLIAGGLLVPVPYTKLSEGVVWMPEGALVRAKASGFIASVERESNRIINKGESLVVMEDPLAVSEVEILKAQKQELEAEYQALEIRDRVRAEVVAQHMTLLNSRLDKAQTNLKQMVVTSDFSGRFVPVGMGDIIGSYVQKGQLLGYILGAHQSTIKTVVDQRDYLLVRDRFIKIDALFIEDLAKPIPLKIIHQVPSATDRLPSRALSQAGGGGYYLDPTDFDGNKALQSHFEFEFVASKELPTLKSGGRVYVRFDLGSEPVFWRIYRNLRHLFLHEFSI